MNECRGQLLERVRRGVASHQDRTAFEAHLGTCESCRLAVDIGDDFDQVGVADSEDAERVARIAAVARRIHQRRPVAAVPPRSSRLMWLLAAAALVVAGGAVAGGWRWRIPRADAPEGSEPAPAAPTVAVVQTVAPSSPRVAPSTPAEPDASVRPSPRPKALAIKPAAVPPTAEKLYRQANEARRSGQTGPAIATYRELQATFPGSAEARLSHVSLGRMLLQGGSAGAALRQFDAYLAGGSGQRLAAEAMFGRGQALQALGRTAEEVQNWRRLIGQYPDSAYATHASHRLKALE